MNQLSAQSSYWTVEEESAQSSVAFSRTRTFSTMLPLPGAFKHLEIRSWRFVSVILHWIRPTTLLKEFNYVRRSFRKNFVSEYYSTIEQQIAISNIGSDAQHVAISIQIIRGEGGADRHPGFKHLAAPSLASKSYRSQLKPNSVG